MASVEESTNRWIREEAAEMCRAAGIDPVPMEDPHFDFFGYGVRFTTSTFGMRGATLYDTVHDVIQRIFFPLTRKDGGTKGTIYTFPEWHRNHPDRGFDDYFILNFKQQSMTLAKWRGKKHRRPGVPILPGKDVGDPTGISEESLEGRDETPLSILENQEEGGSLDKIPALLAEQGRNSHLLTFVWGLLRQGKDLPTIAEELNERGREDPEYRSPRGGLWSAGTVFRLKGRILKLARERFGKRSMPLSARYKVVLVNTPGRVAFLRQGAAL